MKTKKPPKERLPAMVILSYLEHQLFARLKDNYKIGDLYLSVRIGLGCPHYPVHVILRSSELEKQAALILKDIGLPGELTDCFQWPSIPIGSLDECGEANKEKITDWLKQQKATIGGVA